MIAPEFPIPRDDEQRKLWSMATDGIFSIYRPDFHRTEQKKKKSHVPILASMGLRDIYLKAGSNALNEKDIEPILFALMFKFLDSEICFKCWNWDFFLSLFKARASKCLILCWMLEQYLLLLQERLQTGRGVCKSLNLNPLPHPFLSTPRPVPPFT